MWQSLSISLSLAIDSYSPWFSPQSNDCSQTCSVSSESMIHRTAHVLFRISIRRFSSKIPEHRVRWWRSQSTSTRDIKKENLSRPSYVHENSHGSEEKKWVIFLLFWINVNRGTIKATKLITVTKASRSSFQFVFRRPHHYCSIEGSGNRYKRNRWQEIDRTMEKAKNKLDREDPSGDPSDEKTCPLLVSNRMVLDEHPQLIDCFFSLPTLGRENFDPHLQIIVLHLNHLENFICMARATRLLSSSPSVVWWTWRKLSLMIDKNILKQMKTTRMMKSVKARGPRKVPAAFSSRASNFSKDISNNMRAVSDKVEHVDNLETNKK